MTGSVNGTTDESSKLRAELAEILRGSAPLICHAELDDFVRDHPTYGLAHLRLGMSYLLNRFSPDLMLPLGIMAFGGPSHASRGMIETHLEKAEEHLKRAAELDLDQADAADTNLAAVMLARNRFGPVVVFIEELLKKTKGPVYEAQLRSYLGMAYRQLGEYETALSLFRSLLGIPSLRFVHRQIALTLLFQGDLAGANSEMLAQVDSRDGELDRLLLQAIDAEIDGDVPLAVSRYDEIARRCRWDEMGQILGFDAARRAAKLGGRKGWKLTDYCDQLSY